jgi:hypothetical protein
MSDLFEARAKTEEGAAWRGTINVFIDDEKHELTVRQLQDPEFWEVMEMIDREALQSLRDDLDEEKVDEFTELRDSEDLDDGEQERLEELQEELEEESTTIFDALDADTFNGVRKAGRFGVVPDDEDLREAMIDHTDLIEEEYGVEVRDPEDTREFCEDQIEAMIGEATNFVSFTIGLQCLRQTMGDMGNSES